MILFLFSEFGMLSHEFLIQQVIDMLCQYGGPLFMLVAVLYEAADVL
jgi:hypothetical protein